MVVGARLVDSNVGGTGGGGKDVVAAIVPDGFSEDCAKVESGFVCNEGEAIRAEVAGMVLAKVSMEICGCVAGRTGGVFQ